jgi:NADH:ubiquinone oxidoreductase subunit 4 (subunit M)
MDLKYFVAADGLSLVMLLLTGLVTLAAVWVTLWFTSARISSLRASCSFPEEQRVRSRRRIYSSSMPFTSSH